MGKSCFTGIKVEYHILQSFPVVCLNRDDVGAPKTAIVGGVKRARVSSQCWKRQVRMSLHEAGLTIAVRTKKLAEYISLFVKESDIDKEKAIAAVAKALSDDTLVFFSEEEAKVIASYIDELDTEKKVEEASKKEGKKLAAELAKKIKDLKKKNIGIDGLDIALFGRMVAKSADLNVEGAASFSHAITTHKAVSEVDFFTAVDDIEDNAGSGHMGAIEYTSGTFYRYISLDLGQLAENIGEEDIEKAVMAFTQAIYLAVPSARQHTQAGYCPWEYAHIYVRKGQGMQLSFDKAVQAGKDGYLEPSIKAMEQNLGLNEQLMGSLFGKISECVYGDAPENGIDSVMENLKQAIKLIKG